MKSALGNTHIIINNAGLGGNGDPFINGDEEVFQKVLNVNLFGVIHGCRAFIPQLLENDEAAVVNVASVAGLIGLPGGSAYCTSKFAVRGFTETLMIEFHKSPISIHCVLPGKIKTSIADDLETDAYKKTLITPPEEVVLDVIKSIKKGNPEIVSGHQASRVKFLSKYFPLKIRNRLIWKNMVTQLGGTEKFRPFNSLMK